MTFKQVIISILLAVLCGVQISCTGESAELFPQTGTLCLTLSSQEIYVSTRTTDADFTFTLDNSTPIVFTDGKAIVEAGEHTISATNAAVVADGYEGPLFRGSSSFSLVPGEVKSVHIDMGTPQNAKICYTVSDAFAAAYTLQSVVVGDDVRQHTLQSAADEKFLPAGAVTYTITAKANVESYVQEFTPVTGSFTAEAGKKHALSLDINPISGYVRIDVGEDHSGEFE